MILLRNLTRRRRGELEMAVARAAGFERLAELEKVDAGSGREGLTQAADGPAARREARGERGEGAPGSGRQTPPIHCLKVADSRDEHDRFAVEPTGVLRLC